MTVPNARLAPKMTTGDLVIIDQNQRKPEADFLLVQFLC